MSRDIVFNEGGLIQDSEAAVEENEKSSTEDRLQLKVESSIFKNRIETADSGCDSFLGDIPNKDWSKLKFLSPTNAFACCRYTFFCFS